LNYTKLLIVKLKAI